MDSKKRLSIVLCIAFVLIGLCIGFFVGKNTVNKKEKLHMYLPVYEYYSAVDGSTTLNNNYENIGGKQKMGHPIGKMSGNRVVQKEQIDALSIKHHLTKEERRLLHEEISHQGLGYHEIEKLIFELLLNFLYQVLVTQFLFPY